jgi:histidinol dehydrogenase
VTLKIYHDLDEARRTPLRRRDMLVLDDVPASIQAGIQDVFGGPLTPHEATARILADVRERGDEALRRWTARLDGLSIEDFEVPAGAWEAAYASLPSDLAAALELAARRIRGFHARQPLPAWETGEMGGTLGQRVTPLRRVGIYVPGGTAPLPSSLLMTAIPARVAGVDQVVVCTPPGEGGRVPGVTLAAAHLAGADRLFRVGGAQAIGAMAYGTETIPRVDKIAGAGGLFTTLAKRQVYDHVGLDGLYGPTETLIVADDSANPAWVAADLLAQAEHDVLATAILLTPSRDLARAVQAEVTRQLASLGRRDVLAASLSGQGGIILTPDLATAARLADEFAPEHLCLSVREPALWAGRIRNAGGLFLGEHSFEVLGDYVAGPSHVMPTGGTARFASPLNVLDFVKITNVIALDAGSASRLCAAARLASAESLTAHAAAAAARREQEARMKRRSHMSTVEPSHPYLGSIEPYEPPDLEAAADRAGVDEADLIRLIANENPFGPSPRVADALADFGAYHFHPDYGPLREAVACYAGVTPAHVVLSNGADEMIDLLIRLFVEPGEAIVICPPTFSMYRFYGRVNRCRLLAAPRREDLSLDVPAIERAVQQSGGQAKLLFIVSPGNPSGQAIPLAVTERLLQMPLMVAIDEAYVEFGGESAVPLLDDHDNLVIVRSFSKWAGLAGLRLGYALLKPNLADYLERIRPPYNINAAAMVAALATLEDPDAVQVNVARMIEERQRLTKALRDIAWLDPLPSDANFVLVRVRGRDAHTVVDGLAREGILIRGFSSPAMAAYVRISVGRPEQNDALIGALKRME